MTTVNRTNVRLALDCRNGLPDEVAYLRSMYERSSWRAHLNFGELSNWLHVHDSLREKGELLAMTGV